MSFSDFSITWNAVAKVLPRVSTSENRGEYALTVTEGDLKGSIGHLYNKRTRRTARFDLSAISADPLLTGAYVPVSMSAYVVLDVPKGTAFSAATQKIALTAMADWLKAGTNADRFIAGEN